MPIADDVTRLLPEVERQRAETVAFERLREFRDRMLREGLLVTKPYDLPPVDTIGRLAYHEGGSAGR